MLRFLPPSIVAAGASGVLLAVGAFAHPSDHGRSASAEPPREAREQAQRLSDAFVWAADQVRSSVVTVESTQHPVALQGFQQLPGGEMGEWLQRFGFGVPRQQAPRFEPRGEGSGVVMRSDGVILTNNHVVDNAAAIQVRLEDGREFPGKVLGTDPMTDLAVLKIEAQDLPVARFGDSDAVRVGDWVIAVGNPLGLQDTITAGIVSAKGRSDVHITEFEDFLQTDAAINPGNSGGPLVSLNGEVVGINTAIASRTGGFLGVGFAIPANMARRVMDQLLENGVVRRGLLGVMIQPLDAALAGTFGYDSTDGALVSEVNPGSAADAAGIVAGDILTRFDGGKVHDVKELQRRVADTPPGKTVAVEVFRDGAPVQLEVTLTERAAAAEVAQGPRAGGHELGLELQDLGRGSALPEGVAPGTEGALVTQVRPDGVAARSGLAVGDVILEVQGTRVDGARSFLHEVGKHELEEGIRLLVLTGSHHHYLVLRAA